MKLGLKQNEFPCFIGMVSLIHIISIKFTLFMSCSHVVKKEMKLILNFLSEMNCN